MNTLSAKKKLKTRGVYEKLPLATAKRSGINMSETDKVITELKRQLKISGVKYTDVAQALSSLKAPSSAYLPLVIKSVWSA